GNVLRSLLLCLYLPLRYLGLSSPGAARTGSCRERRLEEARPRRWLRTWFGKEKIYARPPWHFRFQPGPKLSLLRGRSGTAGYCRPGAAAALGFDHHEWAELLAVPVDRSGWRGLPRHACAVERTPTYAPGLPRAQPRGGA